MNRTQYTIRRIPRHVDEALRKKARDKGCSLNELALQALTREAGLADKPIRYNDLDHLIGSWKEDPDFDRAMRDQAEIHPDDWK